MKNFTLTLLRSRSVACVLLIFCCGCLCSQTVITNVTIADVEKHRLVPNQMVVITGEVISDIRSSKAKIPSNATVIDGKGKFLMPGMVDAHIHFFQNGGLYTRPDAIDLRKVTPYEKEMAYSHEQMENVLKRYLQHGITTVIDVGANVNFLKQRNDFAAKDFAPSVYMTGPLLTTYQPEIYKNLHDEEPFNLVPTVEDAQKLVQQQLPYKPDFIKIWYIASNDGPNIEATARKNLPIIKAIVEEAHKNGLRVAVHATERITATLAVEAGGDFLVHSVEDELLTDDFVQLLKKNNVILCPTLLAYRGYMDTFGQRLAFDDRELRLSDAHQLGSLLDLRHLRDTTLVNGYTKYANSPKGMSELKKAEEISMANLKKLSDAGIVIASGTDAGNIGTLHASSYLDELRMMRQSGMSNWKVIEASTLSGAKVLGKQNEFGTIAKGKKANLLLLDSNPVENLENLSAINRVINKGVVFEPQKILPDSPADLAQRQLNAYNMRKIDAFLEPYADDVEIYDYPDKLISKGKDAMRKSYTRMFENVPNLHCELQGRIVQGNKVIDKERVRFGKEIAEAVAIYHIENGKIKKVFFIE